jgi:putative transposase
MKRYKVSPEETSFYCCTCTIINWIPVFQKDIFFQIIIESLRYCQTNKGLILHGYVIMPTHLHMITSTKEPVLLPEVMRDFKHFTSTTIIKTLEKENNIFYIDLFRSFSKSRNLDQKYKVWQDEYHPIALKSEKWFNQKLDYMHYNPVRKGFVEQPEQWSSSSARNWLLDDNSIIKIEKLNCLHENGAEAP